MNLTHILVFCGVAAAAGVWQAGRRWLILGGSVLAVYWLQPGMPIRNLDFWLPTATLGMSAALWALTRSKAAAWTRWDGLSAGLIAGIVLSTALLRFTEFSLGPTRAPQVWQVVAALAFVAGLTLLAQRFFRETHWALQLRFWGLIALFIVLKSEPLAEWSSGVLRGVMGQDAALATGFDIRWLGFSYIAFRLLHTIQDRINGRLPDVGLDEFMSFIVFAPALSAGPIDRVERFAKDLNAEFQLGGGHMLAAGERLMMGLLMKFVLADSLALFALNASNAAQTEHSGWMWLLLYAYAFRIFFDFAGYTHIAIGIGMLAGMQLPENFRAPYLKADLTQFWNSWHMTLAQWFRAYFFNPVTRALRQRKWPVWTIILIGQVGTMVLIGLWHGITANFLLWGLWHGLGLFAHNRWAEFSKERFEGLDARLATVGGTLLTFHFVLIGWVWFALPEFGQAAHVLRVLAGAG
jgi:D-alanyl-lipoteichoic acid acyltransferase DltB (MBOAT superfamily)